jgi:cytochrome c oxidase subunit 3
MSEDTILSHGYVPEEHAPEPVISHGDPTPPGKIAIWMFLASEIMFFIGVLGSYIVLRSGSPALFSRHALALSKPLAGINTVVLIFSSVTMYIAVDSAHKGNRGKTIAFLAATIVCAFAFMGIKAVEYTAKFNHHTVVPMVKAGETQYVYDGHVHGADGKRMMEGYRAAVASIPGFNINLVSEEDVKEAAAKAAGKTTEQEIANYAPSEYELPPADSVAQEINYGPWKNVFYASYFTTTGVHAAHVIGGIVALGFLLIHAIRGKVLPPHIEYVGLYWHFVDLVWIFLFPLLYLI